VGDACRVTFDGRTVDAVVALASRGMAMAVTFEAVLGNWVGMMALYVTESGGYVETVSRKSVELTEPEEPT
jgi:hypothetical protein